MSFVPARLVAAGYHSLTRQLHSSRCSIYSVSGTRPSTSLASRALFSQPCLWTAKSLLGRLSRCRILCFTGSCETVVNDCLIRGVRISSIHLRNFSFVMDGRVCISRGTMVILRCIYTCVSLLGPLQNFTMRTIVRPGDYIYHPITFIPSAS